MPPTPHPKPTFAEAVRFWTRLGFISFGGPSGQIAVMHAEVVERRRWVSEERFLHALNYCMVLPGPEATQLAIYLGWLLHGTRGGVAAGTLFVLPAVVLLWALSWLYAAGGRLPALAAVFGGLKAAVVAIVAAAVWRLGRKVLRTPGKWALAAGAFAALATGRVPFPVVVLAAGVCGWFSVVVDGAVPRAVGMREAPGISGAVPAQPTARRSAPSTWIVGLALWLAPTLAAILLTGWGGTLARMGRFFSGTALVTFGGAYAVLPYVADHAVNDLGWLERGQMIDGLGLAETTPGPLIMVLQFVGFLGAWRHPDAGLSPLLAGTLGALLTTWATFGPSFLFVLLGAPSVERLRGKTPRLDAALAAVSAAVVGVMASLAAWFGAAVLFPGGRLDPWALGVAGVALGALTWGRVNVVAVVLGAAALGAARWAALG